MLEAQDALEISKSNSTWDELIESADFSIKRNAKDGERNALIKAPCSFEERWRFRKRFKDMGYKVSWRWKLGNNYYINIKW